MGFKVYIIFHCDYMYYHILDCFIDIREYSILSGGTAIFFIKVCH